MGWSVGFSEESTSFPKQGVHTVVSIGLTETCNVLGASSAVASPSADRVDAVNEMKGHRDTNATKARWFGWTVSGRREYASKEEFARVFECELESLQRLAVLLTADSEAARRCLILAFQECIASSSVSKEWVLAWARRVIIRNAISLVMGFGGHSFVDTNADAEDGSISFSVDNLPGGFAEPDSILELPQLDRFVFVICVLERYSIHDCALLLSRSPREIYGVRHRVGIQVEQIDEPGNNSKRIATT